MLVNDIISLSYVLRLRMEIVRYQNANAGSEFYWHEIFHEGVIFENFFKNLKIFEVFKKKMKGKSPALRVLAREPG